MKKDYSGVMAMKEHIIKSINIFSTNSFLFFYGQFDREISSPFIFLLCHRIEKFDRNSYAIFWDMEFLF